MTKLDRRTLLAAGAAAWIVPATAQTAQQATRSFRVTRGGSDIGTHRLTVSREGQDVRAQTEIAIAVRVLGFVAYRYEMSYTEIYRGGTLISLDATSNDDGDRGFAKVRRNGEMLQIEGTGYTGPVAGTAMPTSYWHKSAVGVTPWISTQSGLPLAVQARRINVPSEAPAGADAWQVSDNDEYDVKVWYDQAGDWTGCSFDASGELGVYTLEPGSGSLTGFIA